MGLLSVDGFVSMHVLQSRNNLHCVALDFEFMKSLPSSEEFIHGLAGAEFKQNVNIFVVFKEVLKPNYVLVN